MKIDKIDFIFFILLSFCLGALLGIFMTEIDDIECRTFDIIIKEKINDDYNSNK